jgi:hypothetical protein
MLRGGTARLAAALLIALATDAIAQTQPQPQPLPFPPPPFQNLMRGTPEEEAACAPDSGKFCRDAEPDPLRVLNCLKRNRAEISVACRRVLERHGQ